MAIIYSVIIGIAIGLLMPRISLAGSFQDNLQEILELDTTLANQKDQVDAQETVTLASKLQFLPGLSAGYSYQDLDQSSTESKTYSLTTSLNLFNGLADYSEYKQGNLDLERARLTLEKNYLDRELNGAKVLIQFLLAKETFDINKKILDLKGDSLANLKSRYSRGLVPLQEVQKGEVDFGNSEARVLSAENNLLEAKRNLKALGLATIRNFSWPFDSEFEALRRTELSSESKLDLLVQSNLIESLDESHKQARAGYLPTVDLSYTWSKTEVSNLDSDERTTLLSVSFPLFSGWSTPASRASALATKLQQAHLYRDQLRLDKANQDVIFKEFEVAKKSSKFRDKNVLLSRKLYRANFKRFENGNSSVNDLLVDLNRLLESEILAAQGKADLHFKAFDLCRFMDQKLSKCLKK